MMAIQPGMTVYYMELSKLIANLKKADEWSRLERSWHAYARPDILI